MWGVLALLVVAWRAGCSPHSLEQVWRLLPLPFAIGLGIVLTHLGMQPGIGLAVFAWATGWLLLGIFVKREPSMLALGLLALWTLVGIGLVLMAASAPFASDAAERRFPRQWLSEHSILLLFALCASVGTVWLRWKRPERLEGLLTQIGKLALFCLAVSILLGLVALANKFGIPLPRVSRVGPWAFAVLAFLICAALTGGNAAELLAAPANIYQWLLKWRWFLATGFLAILALLFSTDFAPTLLLLINFAVIFTVLGQPRVGAGIAFATAIGLYASYWLGVPARLQERIHLMFSPWIAPSAQLAETLWAFARGGVFGQGLAEYFVVREGEAQRAYVAVTHAESFRHSVALLKTDAVWAFVAETSGIAGMMAVLGLAAVVSLWLWHEVIHATDCKSRTWFIVVASTWVLWMLTTLAWHVGCVPIMGLAVPFLSAGLFNSLFWIILFTISLAVASNCRISVEFTEPYTPLPRLAWLLPAAAGLFAILTFAFVVSASIISREKNLQRIFYDLAEENRCRLALVSGWVAPCEGKPQIQEAKLPADSGRRRRIKARLQRWITSGVIVVRDGRLTCIKTAFHRSEPSGIGSMLRATAEEEYR